MWQNAAFPDVAHIICCYVQNRLPRETQCHYYYLLLLLLLLLVLLLFAG